MSATGTVHTNYSSLKELIELRRNETCPATAACALLPLVKVPTELRGGISHILSHTGTCTVRWFKWDKRSSYNRSSWRLPRYFQCLKYCHDPGSWHIRLFYWPYIVSDGEFQCWWSPGLVLCNWNWFRLAAVMWWLALCQLHFLFFPCQLVRSDGAGSILPFEELSTYRWK